MLHKPGVTESLARHIVATRWDDIPAPVRHQAKRSLMNFFAVVLAGCRTGPVEITADGTIHKLSQPAARGSDVNPMDDSGLEEKLRTAAAGWDPRYNTAPLIDAIWAIDNSADVSKLASLAVPRDSRLR